MLALLLTACGGTDDLGQSLCEAQVADPTSVCDGTHPCGVAIAAASGTGGACADELQVVLAAQPADYTACFLACPTDATCDVGGTTINFRSCSCQTDCIRASPADYQDAVRAYAACLEAQPAVASGCN